MILSFLTQQPSSNVIQAKLNSASKSLVSSWLKIARDNLEARFKEQGEWILEDVQMVLTQVTQDDDWLFGEELRREGMELVTEHQKLENDRRYVGVKYEFRSISSI